MWYGIPEKIQSLIDCLIKIDYRILSELLRNIRENEEIWNSKIEWICLKLACNNKIPNQGYAMFVKCSMENKLFSFAYSLLSSLRMTYQLETLRSIANELVPQLMLENINEPRALEELKIINMLVYGMIFCGDVVINSLDSIIGLPDIVNDLVGIHWRLCSAIRHNIKYSDIPVGNRHEIDKLSRESSWIWNPRLHSTSGMPSKSSHPYFAWPEGRWCLSQHASASMNQNNSISLTAISHGSASYANGKIIGSRSQYEFQGVCALFESSLPGHTPHPTHVGKLKSLSDNREYHFSTQSIGDFSLFGSLRRGTEQKSLLAIPNQTIPDGDYTFALDIPVQLATGSFELPPGCKVYTPKPGIFNFSEGWTTEFWVERSSLTSLMHTVCFMCGFELLAKLENDRMVVELWSNGKLEEAATVDAKLTPWIHFVCFGDAAQGVTVFVQQEPLIKSLYVACQLDASYLVSYAGLTTSPISVRHWKIFKGVVRDISSMWQYALGGSVSPDQLELVAWYALHGPGAIAFADSSGHGNHLTSDGQATPRLVTVDYTPTWDMDVSESAQVMMIGRCESNATGLRIHANSCMWTRSRFPITGTVRATMNVCVSESTEVVFCMHSDSWWQLLGPSRNTKTKFVHQLRICIQVDCQPKTEMASFSVSVSIPGQHAPRTLVYVPSTGNIPLSIDSCVVFDVAYAAQQKQLEVRAMGKILLIFDIDLMKHLKISHLDGVLFGVMPIGGTIDVRGLVIESTHGPDLGLMITLPKVPTAQQLSSDTAMLRCPSCTLLNESGTTTCSACGASIGNNTSSTSSSTWQCGQCTLHNSVQLSRCDACQHPNPNSHQIATPILIDMSSAEDTTSPWACTQCTYSNHASASICDMCQEKKPVVATWQHNASPASPIVDSMVGRVISRLKPDFLSESSTMYDWDSTLGIMALSNHDIDEGSYALDMVGTSSEGHTIAAIAQFDNGTNRWNLTGYDIENVEQRLMMFRLCTMELDAEGLNMQGNWYFSDQSVQSWQAQLASESDRFRGIQEVNTSAIDGSSKDFRPFYCGLANMEQGVTNVCYQNALLQCLHMTASLRYNMLFPPPHTETQNSFFVELQTLFSKMLLSPSAVLTTTGFQDVLRAEWTTGSQMDVSDFCDYLLKQLVDCFPENIVEHSFGSKMTQQLTCSGCGKQSTSHQPSLGLNVTLPTQFYPITDVLAVACASYDELGGIMQQYPDYERLRVNLNSGKRDAPMVFLLIQRTPGGEPITELLVRVTPQHMERPLTPEKYVCVNQDLNVSSAGILSDRVYLYFSRDSLGSPITGLTCLVGDEEIAHPPEGWRLINKNINPPDPNGSASIDRICFAYRRGMPITDVVLSCSPPETRNAQYQVVDVPLNIALQEPSESSQDVFLWWSDSNTFPAPLTDVRLIQTGELEKFVALNYQVCGGFVFHGNRMLVKQRGEGCPITQVNVFKAPSVASPFRFPMIVDIRQPSIAGGELRNGVWLPRRFDETKAVPKCVEEIRGKQLQFPNVTRNRIGYFVHGKIVQRSIDCRRTTIGHVYGVAAQSNVTGQANISVMFEPRYQTKRLHPMRFTISEGACHLDHQVQAGHPMLEHFEFPLQIHQLEKPDRDAPIEDIRLYGPDDTVPLEYEIVPCTQLMKMDRANIRYAIPGSSPLRIGIKRVSSSSTSVISQIGIMCDGEPSSPGFRTISKTASNQNAALNLGSGNLLFYLCVKTAPYNANSNESMLFDLVLSWSDHDEKPSSPFKEHSQTMLKTCSVTIGSTQPRVTLWSATRKQRLGDFAVPNLNGIYGSQSLELHLYSVSTQRPAQIVEGLIQNASVSKPGVEFGVAVEGILLGLRSQEPVLQYFPFLSSPNSTLSSSSSSASATAISPRHQEMWVGCATWGDQMSAILTTFLGKEAESQMWVSWYHDGVNGDIVFVKDNYVQLGIGCDSTERWRENQLLYSSRCSNSGVQNMINQSFASVVLNGTDKPLCEKEGVKQLHEQRNYLSEIQQNLIVSIKNMSFDTMRNRAIKHLNVTPLSPTVEIPLVVHNDDMNDDGVQSKVYFGLYGVVVHKGMNVNSGHYVAYARESSDTNLHMEDSISAPWMYFNDAQVSTISWSGMVRAIEDSESNTPYVLFYRRLDSLETHQDEDTQQEVTVPAMKKAKLEDTSVRNKNVLSRLKTWDQAMPQPMKQVYLNAINEIYCTGNEKSSYYRDALLIYAKIKLEL